MYSVAPFTLAAAILHLHMAFMSRNEVAAEWKWVVPGSRVDEFIPMNDLSDDEINEQFNSFMCHATWNPYDQDASKILCSSHALHHVPQI